jgi:hypothetical protein
MVAAQLGSSSQSTTVHVVPFQPDATIQLSGNPNSLPSGAPFTLSATLSITNPLAGDLFISLQVSAAGITTIWPGEQLKITTGQSTGQISLLLPQGSYSWVANLAGHTSNTAAVTVT